MLDDAIERVYRAFSGYAHPRASEDAEALLCGAAAIMDVAPLLAIAGRINADFKLVYRAACSRDDKRKLTNTFWDRDSDGYDTVLAWVYD